MGRDFSLKIKVKTTDFFAVVTRKQWQFMWLKKQYKIFEKIYVTVPDLHFWKAIMKAILRQYKNLGLKQLSTLCGYKTQQWVNLKGVASIPKSFEFSERVADALRTALTFEYFNYLSMKYNISPEKAYNTLNDIDLQLHADMLTTFYKSSSSDLVFQKNLDLLEIIETLLSHYAAERSRD